MPGKADDRAVRDAQDRIDRLMAAEVMNWHEEAGSMFWWKENGEQVPFTVKLEYCTDGEPFWPSVFIESAWYVLEGKLAIYDPMVWCVQNVYGRSVWHCKLSVARVGSPVGAGVVGVAPTAQLAICYAALSAWGVEYERVDKDETQRRSNDSPEQDVSH